MTRLGGARFFLLAGIVAAVAAGAGAWFAHRAGDASRLELQAGTWLPTRRPVAPFALTAQDGTRFSEQRLHGHPSLLFFGFTHCPDVCPTTLGLLAQLRRELPASETRGVGLKVILVSVDPQRDDVPSLQRYMTAFDPHFIGLTGDTSQLDALARSLGAVYQRHDLPGGDYVMDHSATLYLLDGKGQLAAVFTQPLDPAGLRADLRTALAQLRTADAVAQR